jgi:transposase
VYEQPVRGARFVHDELVKYGWEVLVADTQKVKGLAPLACKTDKIDARVLAELSLRDLVLAVAGCVAVVQWSRRESGSPSRAGVPEAGAR